MVTKLTISNSEIIEINKNKISFRRLGTGKRKILFHHGFPGSSAQVELFRPYLESMNLEVICIDRPGYNKTDISGKSQFEQVNKISKDITQHFGWNNFEIVSVSGGTPFLFSFLQYAPNLIKNAIVVSGLSPLKHSDFTHLLDRKSVLALRIFSYTPSPILIGLAALYAKSKTSQKTKIIRNFLPVSNADQDVTKIPQVQKTLQVAITEALMQFGLGPKRDAQAYLSRWKTDTKDYQGPITFWHGEEDLIIPKSMAERLSSVVGGKLHMIPSEGHYSLVIRKIDQILGESSL